MLRGFDSTAEREVSSPSGGAPFNPYGQFDIFGDTGFRINSLTTLDLLTAGKGGGLLP
jgi:hypothetical protein